MKNRRDILLQKAPSWNRWPADFDFRHSGAIGPEAVCNEAHLVERDLSCINLTRCKFRGADLRSAGFSHTILRQADLRHADLRHAHLVGAELQQANLHGADLRHANLADANLMGCDLTETNLEGVDLSQCKIAMDRNSLRYELHRLKQQGLTTIDLRSSTARLLEEFQKVTQELWDKTEAKDEELQAHKKDWEDALFFEQE